MRSRHGRNGSALAGLVLILILTCGAGYYAAGHYFVMTGQGFRIYPKKTLTFEHTYVDLRQCDLAQLYNHRDVLGAMADKDELHLAADNLTLRKLQASGAAASETIRKGAARMDEDYQISDSAREVGRISREKYRKADEKYHLRERAEAARDKMKQGAQRFNTWLKEQ